MEIAIVDLDGTLADLSHRLRHIEKEPKDWERFHAGYRLDQPYETIIRLSNCIHQHMAPVFIVSGRRGEGRGETLEWLMTHNVMHHTLIMRPPGDRRPDEIFKDEVIRDLMAVGRKPIIAIDDRPVIIALWKMHGIPTLTVNEDRWVK